MRTNIIEAICNIVEARHFEVESPSGSTNQANAMGDSLESYIKDAFAGTLEHDRKARDRAYASQFSWLGSKNNPPDIMIREGEAIEVKKTQSALSALSLNSSYPKAALHSNSPMITQECRDCEPWRKKELIYAVGHIDKKALKSLWLVYGGIYAASPETYERIKKAITKGVEAIPDIEFSKTNELGRVNELDPLGVSSLRVRAMWQIDNPRRVFEALHKTDDERTFEMVAVIPLEKWQALGKKSLQRIEAINNYNVTVLDAKVKDPNNARNFLSVKVVKYIVE